MPDLTTISKRGNEATQQSAFILIFSHGVPIRLSGVLTVGEVSNDEV